MFHSHHWVPRPLGRYEHVLFEVDRRRQRKLLRAAFASVDTDGNGMLSADELEDFCLRTLGVEPHMLGELRGMFAEIDEDGSGTVDYDEFERWWTSGKTRSAKVFQHRFGQVLNAAQLTGDGQEEGEDKAGAGDDHRGMQRRRHASLGGQQLTSSNLPP